VLKGEDTSGLDYARLAIRIATSPDELGVLKEALIRARSTSTLFDTAGFCRNLEGAYAEIWARHLGGKLPGRLVV
jgi:predicted O-linked N-acetylglucosamine transferase (SPINDLY family)